MTGTYQFDLAALNADLGPLLEPATPAGEALRWWLQRVHQQAYVGLRDELPSAPARQVLRDRELLAIPSGGWAFVVRSPQTSPDTAIRRNAWAFVAAAFRLKIRTTRSPSRGIGLPAMKSVRSSKDVLIRGEPRKRRNV